MIAFGAVFGTMMVMLVGQLGYSLALRRGLRRNERIRRHMRKLRQIPIERKHSNPSRSNED